MLTLISNFYKMLTKPSNIFKMPFSEVNPRSLDAVVKRMPWQKRMMFHMMSDTNKKQLNKYANQKQRYVNRGCQTDESSIRTAVSNFLSMITNKIILCNFSLG